MALALYRKYRPRTFAEVIGQEHVTEPLSQALRSGRLNHAYLFSGPRGCGKTSSARILARSLNCEHGPTPEPCGTCDSCRSLAGDGAGSIDVIEIDAASHGGVDDARELREKAFFAPANSRFKIYVIDEAHMVSSAGFNALLKLVEEPPEYVKFIFATTEPEKVLGTIKSRTHHYPFRLIPPKVLRPYLEQLCQAEGVQVEPAVFPLVVRAGGGSARDSLSVLDQLIAGAGPDGVTYARAAALLGVTDAALIDEMCDALAAGDGAAAYATIDRVAEAGHDPRRFASDLLERLRDLIVLQQVPDAVAKGLIDGPDDQIERMTAQAQRLGPATLSRCADIVHNGLVDMRGTTAPRLLLELICARMLLPGVDDSTGGLLQRLERMERRLALAGTDALSATAGSASVDPAPTVRTQPPAPPAATAATRAATAAAASATDNGGVATQAGRGAASSGTASGGVAAPAGDAAATATPRRQVPPSAVMPDPVTPEPPRPGTVTSGELDAVAVRRAWPEVVGKVNRSNKKIAALMRDAVVRDLDGDTLVLTVKSAVLARMMSDHAQVLTDALYEELGGRWQIRFEVPGERGGMSPGNPRTTPASVPSRPTPAAPPPSAPPVSAASVAGGVGISGGSPSPGGGSTEDDEGWPEPVRPGGLAAAEADNDWPEAARPGGNSGPGAATAGTAANGAPSGTWPVEAASGGARPGGPALGGPASGGSLSGGPALGGSASGGSLSGGSVPGGSASGGSLSGGSSSGGSVPGGSASGGSVPGGPVPGGATFGGSASGGAMLGGAHGGSVSGSSVSGGAAAGGVVSGGARPGGSTPAGSAAGGIQAGSAAAGARPVSSASGGTAPVNARAAGATPAGAANGPAAGAKAPANGGTRSASASSAIAAARAAAAGRGARTSQTARQTADAEFAGEPPYDPDFDGPVRGGAQSPSIASYEGFDPGDEPLDEIIDEKTARESSEEQALRLLRQAFATTEKISELNTP